jgi:hypothetical protein
MAAEMGGRSRGPGSEVVGRSAAEVVGGTGAGIEPVDALSLGRPVETLLGRSHPRLVELVETPVGRACRTSTSLWPLPIWTYAEDMNSDTGDMPPARVDDEPERAPGGADAVETAQSDVGVDGDMPPVTPEAPLSAQQDEAGIPDALQEPERPEPEEQATDNTDEPSS